MKLVKRSGKPYSYDATRTPTTTNTTTSRPQTKLEIHTKEKLERSPNCVLTQHLPLFVLRVLKFAALSCSCKTKALRLNLARPSLSPVKIMA